MAGRIDELESFKTRINLTQYAAARGYRVDRKASSRHSAVMTHQNGDKIIVAMDADRHWIYFSIGNNSDHGSIVDFVQNRGGGTLGEVRKELRPWLTDGPPALLRPSEDDLFLPQLEPASKDLIQLRARYTAMNPIDGHHRYLEEERRIPAHVLVDPRFDGRIRIDARRNAIFPHLNKDGLCGYEIKNRSFTGFAPGGEKGLWASRTAPDDHTLVIAETAIDALSHFTLKRPARTRYFSTAGSLNAVQPDLIRAAVAKMPKGSKVGLAMDNDEGGDRLLAQITAILAEIKGAGCVLIEDRPLCRDADWNDILRDPLASGMAPAQTITHPIGPLNFQ